MQSEHCNRDFPLRRYMHFEAKKEKLIITIVQNNHVIKKKKLTLISQATVK